MLVDVKCFSKLQVIICVILNAVFLNFSRCTCNLLVEIQQGKLQGMSLSSLRSQNEYFGFMGIPYAKPPVGILRFKAPQPAEPWSGILNATKEGNVCIQMSFLNPVLKGKEDCLFLNIYTSELPDSTKNASLMPVMVWIHGGGFTFGSGNRLMQGPDYLVDEGVVVVTFNYRLGAFGFLSLENKEVPGNAGMKDQVMAMKWIKQNIAKFGGDPKNVTIFGQSAGGASVHYHMLSPMSEGLFHKAISQSGSVLCPWAYTRTARKVAFQLGAALGKNTTDETILLDFLRELVPEKIVEVAKGNLLAEEERDPLGFSLPFVPTKEAVYEGGEEVFLPGEPKELIKEGKIEQVPYMTGTCSHEGYLIYYVSELANITLDELNNNRSQLVLPAIQRRNDMNRTANIGNNIKIFYFGYNNISNETIPDFVKLTTDLYFKYPVYNTVKLHAAVSTSPVFMYEFAFDGLYGYKKSNLGFEGMPGAMHGEELGYLFAIESLVSMNLSIADIEVQMSCDLVKMWTDFAKTGNPTPDMLLNMQWLPYIKEEHNTLLIDGDLSLVKNKDKERMDFCDKLYNRPI